MLLQKTPSLDVPVTAVRGRVTVLWREWKVHCYIAKQETYEVSKHAGRLRNSYSWSTWVLKWVKWPEPVSNHKP